MKKFIVLLVVLVLAGLVTACGGAAAPAQQGAEPTSEQEQQESTPPQAAQATDEPSVGIEAEPTETVATEAPEATAEEAPAAGPRGTLTIAIGADVTSLANTEAVDHGSHAVRHDLYNHLVGFDEQMQIVPELATEWSLSEDKRTWTFKLREDVKFHDGTPFNAEAVKFNFERLLSPDWPETPAKTNLAPILDSVDVIDDFTVAFTTKEPFGAWLVMLADNGGDLATQSPTAVQELGDEFQFRPVGTGPYRFVSWDRDNEIVFEANPDYWGEPPRLERIVYKIIPDAAARAIAVETGEVDVAWLVGIEDLERLEANPDIEVIRTASSRTPVLWINSDNEPFDDVRVRQALNYAIDRDSIVEFVMKGVATPSTCSPIGPGVPGAAEGVCYEYDPDKARELLAEAGVPEGFEFDLWGPSGRYTKDKELVEAVAGQLQAVGLSPTVQIFGDFPTYLQEALIDENLDVAFCSILGVPYDASGYFIFFQSDLAGKPFNISRIRSPEVDELLAAGEGETDAAARQQIYRELQQVLTEEAYHIVLQHEQTLTAVRKNVGGVIVRPSYALLVGKAWKDE